MNDQLVNSVLELMIEYNGDDVRRINHAVKVFTLARHIALSENISAELQLTVECASILHDIGIHNAEKKYNSSDGHYQEIEGPLVAKELISRLDIGDSIKERVLYLIGNHHTYKNIDGIDYQIVVEADFLINIFEDDMKPVVIKTIKEKIFKTKSGIKLLESMYSV